jgi:hypothetical protein
MPFTVTVAPVALLAWLAVCAIWPAAQPARATVVATATATRVTRERVAARVAGRHPGRITAGSSFLPGHARRNGSAGAGAVGSGAAPGRSLG